MPVDDEGSPRDPEPSVPTPPTPQPPTVSGSSFCPNGHTNPVGQQFCGTCGAPLASRGPGVDQGTGPKIWLKRWPVIAVIVAVLAGTGVGVPVLLLRGGSHPVTGTFALVDLDGFFTGPCFGSGGYSDIGPGTQVVVKDRSGKIMATGSLGPGKARGGSICQFKFAMEVPSSDFYSFEVGRRGSITYTPEELEAAGWHVGFSLGS